MLARLKGADDWEGAETLDTSRGIKHPSIDFVAKNLKTCVYSKVGESRNNGPSNREKRSRYDLGRVVIRCLPLHYRRVRVCRDWCRDFAMRGTRSGSLPAC